MIGLCSLLQDYQYYHWPICTPPSIRLLLVGLKNFWWVLNQKKVSTSWYRMYRYRTQIEALKERSDTSILVPNRGFFFCSFFDFGEFQFFGRELR